MSKQTPLARRAGMTALIAATLLALSVALAPTVLAAGGKGAAHEPVAQAGTRGKSPSDPDGLTNGGADKPGMTGGLDSYHDGNNGCGNDPDREDDNNGNCGGRHSPKNHVKPATPAVAGAATAKAAVAGTANVTPALPTVATPAVAPALPAGAQVLGASFTRPAAVAGTAIASPAAAPAAVAGGTLPRTGARFTALIALGLALVLLGHALRLASLPST